MEKSVDNVVPFPTRFSLDWKVIEETLVTVLQRTNVDSTMRAVLLRRMHSFYDRTQRDLSVSLTLPMPGYVALADNDAITAAVESGIRELGEKFHRVISEIFVERLLLEIVIYRAGVTPPESFNVVP